MVVEEKKEISLPVPADLNLTSLDAALDLVNPEIRPTLIVGPDLADIAECLRGERDFTLKIVPKEELGRSSWWVLTDRRTRCSVKPDL